MVTIVTAPTYETVLNTLRACVDERGEDYVYRNPFVYNESANELPACLYLHGNEPGCIIGLMFYKLGWTIENMQRIGGNAVSAWASLYGQEPPPKIRALIMGTQFAQDHGAPWGEALANGITHADAVGAE